MGCAGVEQIMDYVTISDHQAYLMVMIQAVKGLWNHGVNVS
jgi:hypothetical protein